MVSEEVKQVSQACETLPDASGNLSYMYETLRHA
jgi:hypothetical protein